MIGRQLLGVCTSSEFSMLVLFLGVYTVLGLHLSLHFLIEL